jgi:hypothetical protein
MGDEAADDLVTWMMVVDSNRSELRELMEAYNGRMDARFEAHELRIDARFLKMEHAIDARFASERGTTNSQFADVIERFGHLDTSIAQLEARMERRFADLLKWSFVFWVGAVGAVAALAGVLK